MAQRKEDTPAGYYDADEAADILNVHRESLLRSIRKGRCKLAVYEKPSHRTHRKYYFKQDEVDRFAIMRDTLIPVQH